MISPARPRSCRRRPIPETGMTPCSTLCNLWTEAMDLVCCSTRESNLAMPMAATPPSSIPELWSPVLAPALAQHIQPPNAVARVQDVRLGDVQRVDGTLHDFLSEIHSRPERGSDALEQPVPTSDARSDSGSAPSRSLALPDSAGERDTRDFDDALWVESFSLVEMQVPGDTATTTGTAAVGAAPSSPVESSGDGDVHAELGPAWQLL
mmetsp:Transcript_22388/g.70862  ORF Transcript_22388/g.70862 Transcript_22388/m.70862 type:complete len:208 (+) Transcript_22388:44-667(+)